MYSTRAFADLTGVTVKALRHYERLGLLEPRRTRTRYRRYAYRDLQQIERILALKSLGLSLTAIRTLLRRGPISLHEHRAMLEERRARLDRAISALDNIQRDDDPQAAIRRFVADAAWERWEAKRKALAVDRPPDRAPASSIALFHEIAGALEAAEDLDTCSALATRGRKVTPPETMEAWRRRANWPAGLRRYVASCYEMDPDRWERVVDFLTARGDS